MTQVASTTIEVNAGTHTADRKSLTVAEDGRLWLQTARDAGLERSTLEYYEQHLELYIVPLLGTVRLAPLTVPMVRAFGTSFARLSAMVRKAIGSLGAILADAQERGWSRRTSFAACGQDVGAARTAVPIGGRRGAAQGRRRHPLAGEVRALIPQMDPRWRPLLLTVTFAGLRPSELRGLQWIDVDLKGNEVHVRQLADRFNVIGRPKSDAGERTIRLPPMLVAALRQWKLACPKGERSSRPAPAASKALPAVVAAGLLTKAGKPRYTGLQA